MNMTYLLITPLDKSYFRWGGITSPLIRGAMGFTTVEPLPMPSTISGFLIVAAYKRGLITDEKKLYETLKEALGWKLWGPLFYVEGEDSNSISCYHLYPGKLLCFRGEEKCCLVDREDYGAFRMGIALSRYGKTAREGYIYSTVYADLYSLAYGLLGRRKPKKYGILVNVENEMKEGKDPSALNGYVGPLGGESAPAAINVLNDPKLPWKCDFSALLSPAIIDSWEKALDEGIIKVKWSDGSSEGEAEIVQKHCLSDDKVLPKEIRPTVRVLSMGFQDERRKEYEMVLMPGVSLAYNGKKGIGRLTDLGWGSVLGKQ